jgi:hypothetical protein
MLILLLDGMWAGIKAQTRGVGAGVVPTDRGIGRGVSAADGLRQLSEAVPPASWVSQVWCAPLR